MVRGCVVVCSGAWPCNDSGYGIAVGSSLRAYAKHFDKVVFLGPGDLPRPQFDGAPAEWVSYPRARPARAIRFALGWLYGLPGAVVAYRGLRGPLFSALRQLGGGRRAAGESVTVIYEDVPLALWADEVSRMFPHVRQVVRSHNVLSKAFLGLEEIGPRLVRGAWRVEQRRLAAFERAAIGHVGRLWAISDADADEYRRSLGARVDGVLGVAIDVGPLEEGTAPDRHTVIHLGSADLRKGSGLKAFVSECWPKVVAARPAARLVLAGRGTEAFSSEVQRVEGLGFLVDERELFRRGRIFVNPQLIGSGVKIKSVVAMMRGKALVSTPVGVEGIPGRNGKEFVVANDWAGFAQRLVALLDDSNYGDVLGLQGRTFVAEHYSQRLVDERAAELLASVP